MDQFMRIADGIPGGFFIYRAGGDEELLYANPAMVRLFGCESLEELRALTGNSFRGIVHPEDLEAVEESIRRQIVQSQYDLDYVEYRICRRDGTVRWVEDYGHFLHSETAGDVFYVFLGDATEKHRRLEEERAALLDENQRKDRRLQEYHREMEGLSQEHLRRLEMIEALSIDYDSIFYADLEGGSVKPYRDGRGICGGGEGPFRDFAADYIRKHVHPEDREALALALDPDRLAAGLGRRGLIHMNFRAVEGGETEYLQLRAVNVGGRDPATQAAIGFRSMDAETRAELEHRQLLERVLHQANSAAAAKDTFLSNMSHDMRTPLNAVMGFTTLAKRHLGDPERVRDHLDQIGRSAHQLLELIDSILELSRLGSEQSELHEEGCGLLAVAEEVRADLLPRAEEKGLSLTVDGSGLEHTAVYGDRALLVQLLLRLGRNAVKYTGPGGSVTVSLRERAGAPEGYGAYRFVVEDTGIGIGPEFREKLFEPFARERNTTLSGVPGTGLGLPIAKSIVDMLGGRIDVESQVGRGSRFTVSLTLRLQEPAAPKAPAPAPPSASGSRRILMVEDNELNLEIGMELLQDAGYLVESAADGRQAVEMVSRSQPGYYAMVLMDIQMPVMDGYEATRAIRRLPDPALARVPIVALSANAFEEDRRRSLESGMDGHMPKPIDAASLLELVERTIGP